jgi:Leucine-rich repeat (LRR) protein
MNAHDSLCPGICIDYHTMVKLTPLLISEVEAKHPQEIKILSLPEKEFDDIDDISCCCNLIKLNLRGNRLVNSSLEGISHNEAITTLDLSENRLETFEGVEHLVNLAAFNVSQNDITYLSSHLLRLPNLKALVAKGNQISRIENLGNCCELNTLGRSKVRSGCIFYSLICNKQIIFGIGFACNIVVLSNNKISEISNIGILVNLKKLAASYNPIRMIPDLALNINLRELRLSHCKITQIPETIKNNPGLEIIDLGSNLLSAFLYVFRLFFCQLFLLQPVRRVVSIAESLFCKVKLILLWTEISSTYHYFQTFMICLFAEIKYAMK